MSSVFNGVSAILTCYVYLLFIYNAAIYAHGFKEENDGKSSDLYYLLTIRTSWGDTDNFLEKFALLVVWKNYFL